MPSPSGIPISIAAKKPSNTRNVLRYVLIQKLGSWINLYISLSTALGGGICETHGNANPNQACERDPTSQKIRNTTIATMPRQKSSPVMKLMALAVPEETALIVQRSLSPAS